MKLARTSLAILLAGTFSLSACGGGDDKETDPTEVDSTGDNAGDDADAGDDGGGGEGNEDADTTAEPDETDADNDSGGGGGGDNGDCAGIELPPEYTSLIENQGSCEFIECIFDELGVSNPEEFEEKFGDTSEADPAQIGQFSTAIAACAQALRPDA